MSEIFDDFARDVGGAYYPDSNGSGQISKLKALLDGRNARALDRLRLTNPQLANSYRLESGWIYHGQFNARAGIRKEVDCIGINLGVIHILRNLFLSMLSHPRILPSIGNPSLERIRGPYNLSRVTASLEDFRTHTFPNDQVRLQYCSHLFSCGFNFIFQHEFGHLFHGHVDWFKKTYGLWALSEVGASKTEKLRHIDLQTLEVDADGFAAIDVFAEILRIYRTPQGALRPATTNLFGKSEDAVFGVLFAIYSVFRLFADNENLDDENILLRDHPPALYRQRFLLAQISEYVLEHEILSPPDFGRVTVSAMVEAEQAFSILTGKSVLHANQLTEPFARSDTMIRQLASNWKLLRPELDLLKRGGELPK